MKALITGASGFLGGSLGRRLVADGWKVRGLVRSDGAARKVEAWGGSPARGDVTAPASLPGALEGVDALFHAAASVDVLGPHRASMLRTNVEGTRNVLEAAQKASVPRTVYYSSVAAIGRDHTRADETTWHTGRYHGVYEESKHKAELVALDAGRRGLDVVHILPSVVIGPGDPKTGAFFLRFLRGGVPARPRSEGGTSFVHVEDVTDGAVRAHAKGRANERYILSAVTWTMTEFFEALRTATGIPPPRKVPTSLVYAAAVVEEWRAALARRRPRLSRNAVSYAARRREFVSTKARRELGWDPPPFMHRFRETLEAWQREARHG